ncbi:hypothetical protein LCGC14_1385050 [marine sediment metagenome]|uniref:Uncharacterized protein n=1 Tax=marine sediment metagenome TaxID=412755 RepID=A0A0F9K1U5_9ZZZZ
MFYYDPVCKMEVHEDEKTFLKVSTILISIFENHRRKD